LGAPPGGRGPMSTAGKVLAVLVTLALFIWMGLLSTVAQRNANWGKKLQAQQQELEGLQKSQADLRDQLANIKGDIAREQENHDKAVVVLRAQVADREKTVTNSIEELERKKNQVKSQAVVVIDAESHLKHRNEDKAKTEADLAAKIAEVEKLTGENGTLMAQLKQLRTDFLTTMAENRKLVKRFATQ
jgi:hypothetical protein